MMSIPDPLSLRITRGQFLRGGLAAAAAFAAGPAGASAASSSATAKSGGQGAARLRFYPIDLHLRHAWTLSRNTSTQKRNYIVELTCDGITGRGEAAPNVRFHETPESVAEALKIAGAVVDAVHPAHRVELGRRLLLRLPAAHSARCAVDMAAWDWHAQSLGAPLYRCLGLDPQAAPLTSFSLSIAARDELAHKVREAAAYPLLKVKLGARPPLSDREIIDTIIAVAPEKRLRVDPNEGWTPAEARDELRWLAGLRRPGKDGGPRIELCEQPLPAADLDALRSLYQERKSLGGLPILLDESVLGAADIPRLAGACDGVVLKLQKAGGISPVLAEIAVARALGLQVMLGCMIESSLGITAAAHLAPLCDYVDLDGNLLVDNDPFRGVHVSAGVLTLPSGAGLGVVAAGHVESGEHAK